MRNVDEIREFRNALAGKHKVQPSAVFPDSSIEMLAELQPKTLAQLSGKPQFPKDGHRMKVYGKAIIDFFKTDTKEFEKSNSFK